jgi:hypothetical protein
MSEEEFRVLSTEAGAVQFIAAHTGLPGDRVVRIYRLGQPWPLFGEGWDLGRQAEEAGIDPIRYLIGLSPLINFLGERAEAQLAAGGAALARGEAPEPCPELEFPPEVQAHHETVANLTGESIDTVRTVLGGIIAWLLRLNELVAEEIHRRAPADP